MCACGRLGFEESTLAAVDATTDSAATTCGTIQLGEVTSDGGFAWVEYRAIGAFGGDADDLENLFESPLRLFEDGLELGPAHAAHVDIRDLGLGRFSHWTDENADDGIRFSASDNSDPRSNGRAYVYCPDGQSP